MLLTSHLSVQGLVSLCCSIAVRKPVFRCSQGLQQLVALAYSSMSKTSEQQLGLLATFVPWPSCLMLRVLH